MEIAAASRFIVYAIIIVAVLVRPNDHQNNFLCVPMSVAVHDRNCFSGVKLISKTSSAYLQHLMGDGTQTLLEFVKEMPKPRTELRQDISFILGTLFFIWVILQLFPVVLGSMVYEKEQKLRIMMKMHGRPYWMISYAYFLFISVVYMLCFVIFGSVVGDFTLSCR